MKTLLAYACCLALIVVIGCTTKDGNLLSNSDKFGSLRVTTNVDGAQIFLDGEDTGEVTPATLENVLVGDHVLQVFLANFEAVQGAISVTVQENQQTDITFDLVAIQSGASLSVTSTPDSALVLINGVALGDNPYTPLLLEGLAPGSYQIEILKGSHEPVNLGMVELFGDSLVERETSLQLARAALVEHFSSSTCIPCVEADTVLEKVLYERGLEYVVSIGYHTEIPAPGDPMFDEASDDNNERIGYYSVTGNPVSYIDGVSGIGGVVNLENRLRSSLDDRLTMLPEAILEIFDFQADSSNLSGRVRIESLADLSGYQLRLAIIEREITYDIPPGINGVTHFFDVFRGFVEGGDGTPLLPGVGVVQSIPFNAPVSDFWNTERIEIVAFIQEPASREVAQAAWTLYP